MSHNLDNYMEVAVGLVKEVGSIIKTRIWSKKTVETKDSNIDFVTETDKEVEQILINGLKSSFPDHQFIGEETTSSDSKPAVLTDEPTWIIDPVDGTMNFVHGNPHVCVSVGLYINKESYLGIIHVPVYDLLLTALKGKGAFLNEKQVHVSSVKDLSDALVLLEGGSSREPDKLKAVIDNFSALYPYSHGFRSSGSAAYNITMVAIGAADAYLEFGCHAWDMAAGNCIVTEAGGVMIDPAGGEFDILSRRLICASSDELAQQIASKITQYYPKRDDAE